MDSYRKLFDSCTSKVDSLNPIMVQMLDISIFHECKQTLDVSAGTSINVQKEQSLDLSAGDSKDDGFRKLMSVHNSSGLDPQCSFDVCSSTVQASKPNVK
ncbi:hypothetical protein Tco_0867373 [Tanacetum coccineum]